METINTVELRDEAVYPDEQVLRSVLGGSFSAFEELMRLYESYEMTTEWRYYRDGKAWLCKVQKKKRTIIWMSAWKGYMQASAYIPLKYLDQALALGLSAESVDRISNTKDVGKSRPFIFEIRRSEDLANFERIMKFKMENK